MKIRNKIKYLLFGSALFAVGTVCTEQNIYALPEKTSSHSVALRDSTAIAPEQSVSVDDSYFADAVFIGDSRMEGFHIFSGLEQGTFLTAVGFQIDCFYKTTVATASGTQTVLDALPYDVYTKVYVNLGVNDLGWYDWNAFKERYTQVLKDIQTVEPNAIMYVCGTFYVEESKISSSTIEYVNNTNVNRINEYILEICEENGYQYLDINYVMDDGSQSLFSDASSDGIHVEPPYCRAWLEYLKCHYVTEESLQKEDFSNFMQYICIIEETVKETVEQTGIVEQIQQIYEIAEKSMILMDMEWEIVF